VHSIQHVWKIGTQTTINSFGSRYPSWGNPWFKMWNCLFEIFVDRFQLLFNSMMLLYIHQKVFLLMATINMLHVPLFITIEALEWYYIGIWFCGCCNYLFPNLFCKIIINR
jgi:hypothetical protein